MSLLQVQIAARVDDERTTVCLTQVLLQLP
jgi:hypothetical protein